MIQAEPDLAVPEIKMTVHISGEDMRTNVGDSLGGSCAQDQPASVEKTATPVESVDTQHIKDRVFKHIPLPHKNSPEAPCLPKIAARLAAEHIISPDVLSTFSSMFRISDTKLSALYLLSEWKKADDAGIRGHNAPSVFQPDLHLYPDLKPSSFRPDVLEIICAGEQKEVVDFLLDGFCNGFQLFELPETIDSVEYANMKPPDEEAAAAMRKCVSTEHDLGCIGRRPEHMLEFVSSPIFAVAKKKDGIPTGKYRQAHHLSREDRSHDSVNVLIRDEDAEIEYDTVLHAVKETFDLKKKWREMQAETSVLGPIAPSETRFLEKEMSTEQEDSKDADGRAMGKPVEPDPRVSKKDAARAFRIFPIDPRYYRWLGFTDLDGRQWFESRLCFGLRCAPRMYSALSNTISWLLKHVFGIDAVICYLDDFLLISIDLANSKLASAIASLVFALLGMPMQTEKDEEDVDNVVFLGVHMFFQTEKLCLSRARLENLLTKIAEWQARTDASAREVARLCGLLAHASRVIGVGRLFLNRLYRKIHFQEGEDRHKGYEGLVRLGKEFQKDMSWWARFLRHYNGVSAMIDTEAVVHPTVDSYTDAASTVGAAGVELPFFWQVTWSGQLKWLASQHINVQEAWALPTEAMHRAEQWRGKLVRIHCDNQSDVLSVRAGRSKNKNILHYLRVLYFISALYSFKIDIQYIHTSLNIADQPSRVPAHVILQDPCSPLKCFKPLTWVPPLPEDPQWEEEMAAQLASTLSQQD